MSDVRPSQSISARVHVCVRPASLQCITGGIIGVGLMEGVRAGVNWMFFARIFSSWVSTLAVVGLATAAIFAQVRCGPGLRAYCLAAKPTRSQKPLKCCSKGYTCRRRAAMQGAYRDPRVQSSVHGLQPRYVINA